MTPTQLLTTGISLASLSARACFCRQSTWLQRRCLGLPKKTAAAYSKNAAARVLEKGDLISPALRSLRWLRASQRVDFKNTAVGL